jgi:hypothetical protein
MSLNPIFLPQVGLQTLFALKTLSGQGLANSSIRRRLSLNQDIVMQCQLDFPILLGKSQYNEADIHPMFLGDE